MSSQEYGHRIIQYVPFVSFINQSFWHRLTDSKLNIDKLEENAVNIYGRFSNKNNVGTDFVVNATSFNTNPEQQIHYIDVMGTHINKNTMESFKAIHKAVLLNRIGHEISKNIQTASWIKMPSCLLNFFVLTFADIKKFHYYYWVAFPSPNQPTVCIVTNNDIRAGFTQNHVTDISQGYKELDVAQRSFFIITEIEDKVNVVALATIFDINKPNCKLDISKIYFGFSDPSNNENPGWPLKMFLAALLQFSPMIKQNIISVIGLRCSEHGGINESRLFTIRIPNDLQLSGEVGWVGWERNDKGNFGPRLAKISAMDPITLADTSADLNIKLMRWRLVPDLNLNIMKETKCLLLGAGTLGCHVARDLLAWGFRNITFIDNGKVSYSNPTRQVLFNFQDCLNGGRGKAEAAASNLELILPTVKTVGLSVHIPMPGHPFDESLKDEFIYNINILTEEILNHDVIFLLLDTIEARWLPTLIAACNGKIVINASVDFDSYLVMRHGNKCDLQDSDMDSGQVSGEQLACYFCTSVISPRNSLKDRTLDQQCTVTRPGVAAIAGALAVELLVALLQHPLRLKAPAIFSQSDDIELNKDQGVLGVIPHSIRGFLYSYQTLLPNSSKFDQCIACSNAVLDKYKERGVDFVLEVLNNGKYLEEVCGLTELMSSVGIPGVDVVVLLTDEEEEDE